MFSRERQKVNFSRLPALWLHPARVPHAEDRCSAGAQCLQNCAWGAARQAEQKDFSCLDITLWSLPHPVSPMARPACLSKLSGAKRCSRCSRCSPCPLSCHLWTCSGCSLCKSCSAMPSTWGCAEPRPGPAPAGSLTWRCLPGPARCRSESHGHRRPNKTVLQSTACRFTSAQMETELSRSLSPRPARRQYLS